MEAGLRRVITSDSDWKYVNVRRLLIFIEARGLRPRNEHSAPVNTLCGELGLKEPGTVTVLIWVRLLVAEEEGDRPVAGELSHDGLDADVGDIWVGRAKLDYPGS